MEDFLEKTFYNNTMREWLLFLAIIVGVLIGAKVLYWISGSIVKKLTQRTKSKFDDILVDKLEEPIILAFVLGGIWFSIHQLVLSQGFSTFVDKAFYVAITFNVAWLVVRVVDAFIVEYLQPLVEKSEGNLDDQLLPVVRKVFKIVIWSVAVVVGLNNAGYDVGALIAGLGIGGFAFAIAAKDSVANLFGGVTVFLDKPFQAHDRIKIDGYDGVVEEIGLRSTKMRTLAGRIVTIPNHKFTESYIENVSSEPNRKMNITLGLTYDTDHNGMQKAIDILKKIDKESEYTGKPCLAYFDSFGDFSLNIQFTYFLKSKPDYWFLGPDQINKEILKEFNQAGLEFAFPTQTIISQES